MKIKFKGANCERVNILDTLSGIFTDLNAGSIQFDEAQEKITAAHIEWRKSNKNSISFLELLQQTGLNKYGFEIEEDVAPINQLAIDALNIDDPKLFRYRDTAKNIITAQFSHQVFDYLFVNRSVGNNTNPYITSKSDFNQGVVNLKNSLCQFLVSKFKVLEYLQGKTFFNASGAISEDGVILYQELMNALQQKTKILTEQSISDILADPITYADKLKVLQAIIVLNNFDKMLSKELSGLIQISPESAGKLNNHDYTHAIAGNATEYWAADTHEDKSMKNYTSNLAKFILKQIPKVKRLPGGGFTRITGQYLQPNELYILAAVIKEAESEWNLINPEDPIVLATDLVNGIKKLFDNRSYLRAFNGAKRELIDSLDAFLWAGEKGTSHSISQLYQDNFPLNQNILDIESIIGFEIYQSSNPSYVDFSDPCFSETTNFGGLYRSGATLRNNIMLFLHEQLLRNRKSIGKKWENSTYKEPITDTEKRVLLRQILHLEYDDISDFDDFIDRHETTLRNLLNQLAAVIHNKEVGGKRLYDSIHKLVSRKTDSIEIKDEASVYNALKNIANAILKSIDTEFKEEYKKIISDSPVSQFDSFSGATIPVYRLNSALTHTQWFMHQYRQSAPYAGLNFLVDNPIVLSKYKTLQKDTKKRILSEWNSKYKGQIAYMLGIGDASNYTGYDKLPPADQIALTTFLNIGARASNLFYVQPVCYSDKVSVGEFVLNLEAQFKDPLSANKNATTTLADILKRPDAVEIIRTIDFYQRQKNISHLINSILAKWHACITEVLNGPDSALKQKLQQQLFTDSDITIAPLSNEEIQSENLEKNKKTIALIESRFNNLNKLLGLLNKQDFQEMLDIADRLPQKIELVDELDYVKNKSGQLYTINKTILHDFKEVKNKETFLAAQEKLTEQYLTSPEYIQMLDTTREMLMSSTESEPPYKLLVRENSSKKYNKNTHRQEYEEPAKYFEVKQTWVKTDSGKSYPELSIEPVYGESGIPRFEEELRKQLALHNLGSFAAIDLVSKSYYLDPAKIVTDNGAIEKSKRIEAMAKRMVLFPATIQAYQQGKIDGVSQEAQVCVIEDPQEQTWNMNGDEHGQDIYDGCGFSSPFWSMMEDNSLPGHGIQGTKKTLGTSTRGTSSALFKWASFPITNEKMRMSTGAKFSLQNLFYKMHNLPWDSSLDITTSYLGMPLTDPGSMINKNMYFSDGFSYYKILSLRRVDGYNYDLEIQKVNEKGKPTKDFNGKSVIVHKPVQISTIAHLWQALGGINSMELVDGILENSEASIEATFKYIINVGTLQDGDPRHIDQSNVDQPLRHLFKAIAANKSSIKRGAANINTAEKAWAPINPNDPSTYTLRSFTINTSCFGIQLDANHHADMSDVREMSQTISTLAGNGYTMDLAEQAYNAIGDLVDLSITKVSKYLNTAQQKGLRSSISLISNRLVERLATEDKINSTDAFIDIFTEDLQLILPLSDRRFYKLFVKQILEELNKSSIKRRYQGMGGILNPAGNIVQLYNVNGQSFLYPTLLKTAKKELGSDPFVANDIIAVANQKGIPIDKAIVDYYLAYKSNSETVSHQDLLDMIGQKITMPVDPMMYHNKVKILDTIRYQTYDKESGWSDWTEVTLDTCKAMIDFEELMQQRVDFVEGSSSINVELVLSTPHDLRPQSVTWTSINYLNNNTIESKPQSVYTTIGARLQTYVGLYSEDDVEFTELVSEFSQMGQELQYQCKV